ncbi:hypothetical protein ACFPME_07330 [Rhodanobacter umsongensis]|uniref:Uncharacterized protein n=1 Tax=Rhodanobacter umsongensis TaxID=633153 RepID=A0ABW0JJY1_9GAMM
MHHADRHVGLGDIAAGTWLALGMLVLGAPAIAADAHKAVQVQHGEIVVLRNVSARPAYRQAPPGMALIVSASPRHELDGALGTGELSDADYADLNATSSNGNRGPHGTTLERITDKVLGGRMSARADTGSAASSANGLSNAIAAPMGSIGRATGSIGNQVQGAFSQLPGLAPSNPAGH